MGPRPAFGRESRQGLRERPRGGLENRAGVRLCVRRLRFGVGSEDESGCGTAEGGRGKGGDGDADRAGQSETSPRTETVI